jgi:sarcosine oxidase subunit beta
MRCCREFADGGAQIDYERKGALLVCEPEHVAAIVGRLDRLRELGFDCEWLAGRALGEHEPRLASTAAGALLLRDLAQVSPMRTVNELARRAQERGAVLMTNTEVLGIQVSGDRVTSLGTGQGSLATENVIIAGGAWSPFLAKMVNLRLPVLPLKGHVLVTEPVPDFIRYYISAAGYEAGVATTLAAPPRADGAPAMPPQIAPVLQPLPSGQILIGSSREFAGYDRQVNRTRLTQLAQGACAVVPSLKSLRVIRTYAGLRPWSPDGRPIIGATERVRGVYFATGHAGEGNTRALITAQILADLFMGRTPALDPLPLAPDRFPLN